MLFDWTKHIATRDDEEHRRMHEVIAGLEASYRAEARWDDAARWLSARDNQRQFASLRSEVEDWRGWALLHVTKLVARWNGGEIELPPEHVTERRGKPVVFVGTHGNEVLQATINPEPHPLITWEPINEKQREVISNPAPMKLLGGMRTYPKRRRSPISADPGDL